MVSNGMCLEKTNLKKVSMASKPSKIKLKYQKSSNKVVKTKEKTEASKCLFYPVILLNTE